jgi:hypothetical protein
MAIDPSVLINLAAEYTGKPAFDKAEKATTKLQKTVKGLGKAFGVAFAASTVVNYSQKAVKAFAADEAAALRLTRAVDNLGIGFANPAISKYIANLERSSAIADDILRPAFQALLTTTGSLTKSQELLNNAIQISRASGIDLATVSQDLANGYVGITKGLKKYNTGLTTAELSSKSFADVLGVMLTKSAGAAQDYLSTTQYKMDALTLATGNASEIIGGGLVNAFARIAGGTEASDAQIAIEAVATGIAHITEATGAAIGAIPNLLKMLGNLPKNIFQGFAGKAAGVNITPTPTVTKTPTQLTAEKQAKLLAKLEADAAKRAKQLLALQKKQTDAAKKAAADKAKLDKAASVFDLQKISIAAALKGKISEEEKTRLLLMQAIADEDATKAEALAKKLEEIQKKNEEIAKSLLEIQDASNPFEAWATSLGAAAALLKAMPPLLDATGGLTGRGKITLPTGDGLPDPGTGGGGGGGTGGTGGGGGGGTGGTGGTGSGNTSIFGTGDTPEEIANKTANAAEDAAAAATAAAASVAESQNAVDALAEAATNGTPATGSSSMYNPNPYSAIGGPGYGIPYSPVYINVTNEGSVITQDNFVTAVNEALVLANQNGYNNYRPGAIVTNG